MGARKLIGHPNQTAMAKPRVPATAMRSMKRSVVEKPVLPAPTPLGWVIVISIQVAEPGHDPDPHATQQVGQSVQPRVDYNAGLRADADVARALFGVETDPHHEPLGIAYPAAVVRDVRQARLGIHITVVDAPPDAVDLAGIDPARANIQHDADGIAHLDVFEGVLTEFGLYPDGVILHERHDRLPARRETARSQLKVRDPAVRRRSHHGIGQVPAGGAERGLGLPDLGIVGARRAEALPGLLELGLAPRDVRGRVAHAGPGVVPP